MTGVTQLSDHRPFPDLSVAEFAVLIALLRAGPHPAGFLIPTLDSWFDTKLCVADLEPTIARLIDYEGFCGITEVAPVPMISASDLSERLRSDSETLLLDVREANEVEKASIAGSQWIALGELSDRVGELEAFKDRPIVVHCHLGGRSAEATRLLMDRGFENVKNLDGGIDAWSLTVDPDVPRY